MQRITINDIKTHPWFLKNLPRELTDAAQAAYYRKNPTFSLQSVEEVMKIVAEAKTLPPASRSIGGFGWGGEEHEEKEEDVEGEVDEDEDEDEEDEYDKAGTSKWRGSAQLRAIHLYLLNTKPLF